MAGKQEALPAGTVRQGRHAVIEQLLADGLDVMFGNPGTVEQGFLNALESYPGMSYILTLHETIAVMAADGYARARAKPAVVQIHSAPGLGNALGAIYQAKRGHAPLIILGGDAGLKYLPMQAQMYADLQAMAEPVTKLSTVIQHKSSLLRVLRRAVKVACTPPMGPVYVCLPADVLDEISEEPVFPSVEIDTRSNAQQELVERAAAWLLAAERPRLFIGDGIHYAKAGQEIARLAETVGADIFGVDAGESNVPLNHPLYRGQTGHMFGEQSLPITQHPDVLVVSGTYMLPEVFPELGEIYAPSAKVIHFDLDTDAIAKNHRVDLAMLSDPRATAAAIADAAERLMTAEQRQTIAARRAALAAEIEATRVAERAKHAAEAAGPGASMAALALEFFRRAPDAVLVDEALTNSPPLVRAYADAGGDHLVQTRGGSLGMGLASALGVQLASKGRTVISASGDGGGMYTVQSLWSAARHHLPVKYLVCSNGTYHLLQLNILQYWKSLGLPQGQFPTCFDLSRPQLRFDELARAMSVPAVRVRTAAEIPAAVEQALATDGPFLIDLELPGAVRPDLIGVRCGH